MQDEESDGEQSAEELAELYQDFIQWLNNAEDKLSLMEEQWLKDEKEEVKDISQARKNHRKHQVKKHQTLREYGFATIYLFIGLLASATKTMNTQLTEHGSRLRVGNKWAKSKEYLKIKVDN